MRAVPPLEGLCYRNVRSALSVERRGQLLEERATKCILRGCIYTPFGGGRGFLRAPPTYTLAPHVRLPGNLQIIASRRRGRTLNGILACFPDGATIRITCPADYCCLTSPVTFCAPPWPFALVHPQQGGSQVQRICWAAGDCDIRLRVTAVSGRAPFEHSPRHSQASPLAQLDQAVPARQPDPSRCAHGQSCRPRT